MTMTKAKCEAVYDVLRPIRAGRKNVVCRRRDSLGDSAFVDGVLAEASRLGLSALETDGSIVILKPGDIHWLLNPQPIAAIAA